MSRQGFIAPWSRSDANHRHRLESMSRIIAKLESFIDTPTTIASTNTQKRSAIPVELIKAHRANDAAILDADGFSGGASDSAIVARLFKMYQELTAKA